MSDDWGLDIPFSLSNPWGFARHGVPLRSSIPLPRGGVRDPAAELCLEDEDGNDAAAQWRVLSRWQDGAVRFALMDYAAGELAPRSTAAFMLRRRPTPVPEPAAPAEGIRIRHDRDSLCVDTGRLAWTFSTKRFSFAEGIDFDGREWIDDHVSDAVVKDSNGQVYRASEGEYAIGVEESGPHRVVVLIRGDYRNPLGRFMNYWARFHFTRGGSQVLMLHHMRNREPGREGRDVAASWLEGGLGLGDSSMRRLLHRSRTRNAIQAPIDVPENVDIDVMERETAIRNEASLREDSDDVLYSLKHDLQEMGTNRSCAPMIDLLAPGTGGMLFKFVMANPNLQFPMRLASNRNRFQIDFFPESEGPYHFNEGMGKTRDVLFCFHNDELEPTDLFHSATNLSYPGVVGVPDRIHRQAQFADVHLTLPKQPNKYPVLERRFEFMKAPGSLELKQAMKASPARNNCCGWRDFGDYVHVRGRTPEWGVRQYVNNEEDYVHAAMLDAWRQGKAYDGLDMARHVMDVDYIDFSTDPARDGGVCPHSTNHTDGEVYPSHQWCQGLLYFYLATGDEEALRIAKRIGDCLVWWITGPRSVGLRFTGRESAWPLLSLAALYEVTGEEKYRDAGMRVTDQLLAEAETHGDKIWEHPAGSGIRSNTMLPMTFNGIWDMYAATGEKRILDLWKTLTRPVVEALDKPDSFGYVHFRNAHLYLPDLTVLVRWYSLTGDRKYLELGRNGLRLFLTGCPEPYIQCPAKFAMTFRHVILFLKLADEEEMLDDSLVTHVW